MQDPAFEALLQEFKEAGRPQEANPPTISLQVISVGIEIPKDQQVDAKWLDVIPVTTGISEPVMSYDSEHRDVHTFTVDNEWVHGEARVVVNRIKGVVTCDAVGLCVKPPYADKGYVITGFDLGVATAAGDFDGDSIVRRPKKRNRESNRVPFAMMNLLGRAQ